MAPSISKTPRLVFSLIGASVLALLVVPSIVDRIELGTYMLAPAIAGGEVELLGGRIDLIESFVEKLDAAGVDVRETANGIATKRRADHIKAVDVTTEVFPGFPTDLQAQMMAMLCTADGVSNLEETIFEKLNF